MTTPTLQSQSKAMKFYFKWWKKSRSVRSVSTSIYFLIQNYQWKPQRKDNGTSTGCQWWHLHRKISIIKTYRRFKDLQKNRKPEPFYLTELHSDIEKEKQIKPKKIEKTEQKPVQPSKPKDIFDDFEEKPKQPKLEQKKSAEVDIFDIACEPKKEEKKETTLMDLTLDSSAPSANQANVNIFDLLGSSNNEPVQPANNAMQNNYMSNMNNNGFPMNPYPTNNSVNFSGMPVGNPYQSNNYTNVSLTNNFQTENVIAVWLRICKNMTIRT